MTEPDKIPDTMLLALADDELTEPEAARVRAALARDPALAREYEALRATRRLLAGLHADTLHEKVPDRLLAAVLQADAATRPAVPPASLHGAAARPGGPRPRPARAVWQGFAIAASLALVLGGVVGFGLGRMGSPAPGQQAPALAGLPDGPAAAALAGALERAASGSATPWPGGRVTILHSHPTRLGICRDFVLEGGTGAGLAGLACREGGAWVVRLAVQRGAGGDATRPAGGEEPLVQDLLDRIEAGAPLDAGAERAAIARGWR